MSTEGRQFQRGDPSGHDDRPEDLWRAVEASIRQKLEESLDFASLAKHHTPENIEEARVHALQRERRFFIKVLSKVQEVVARHPQTAVLFDVDETLGSAYFPNSQTLITLLRPSLFPLFERLRAMQVDIGLFTSRSKESLLLQLQDARNLLPIHRYLLDDLIFSSRGYYGSGDSESFAKSLKKDYGGEYGIVDDAALDATDFNDYPMLGGDQSKLALLKQVRTEIPNKAVIVVDDFLRYPDFLNEKNGLYGVRLDNTEIFLGRDTIHSRT